MCPFPLCVPFYSFSIFKCSLSYQPLCEVISLHLFAHCFFSFGMCSDILLRLLGCNGVTFLIFIISIHVFSFVIY
jgi:hypothetical protein